MGLLKSSVVTSGSLQKWNKWLAGLYFVQALAIVVASQAKSFPITASLLNVDSLQSTAVGQVVLAPATHHLFDINMVWLVALFLLIPALFHLLQAMGWRKTYEMDLTNRQNRLRWIEYTLSASLMLVAIAIVVGMYDLMNLVFVAALSVTMHLLFWALDANVGRNNKPKPAIWAAYGIGILAGCIIWLSIILSLVVTNVFGNGHVPGYVYGVVVSLIIICTGLAGNLLLQVSRHGAWKNYLYGERLFVFISFAAKTALAWQIFAGVLKP